MASSAGGPDRRSEYRLIRYIRLLLEALALQDTSAEERRPFLYPSGNLADTWVPEESARALGEQKPSRNVAATSASGLLSPQIR